MRYLYTILFYLFFPAIVLRLYWRSLRLPAYRQRMAERLGFFEAPEFIESIWIHVVSVGEFLGALPFIKSLQARHPERDFVITTTTPTGSARVRETLGDEVFHVYAPYDMPGAIKRFLKKTKPCLAIFMETEIWPNYLYYCHQRGVKTVLINGRLSERSAKGYLRFQVLTKQAVNYFDCVMAQFDADAERYLRLGVSKNRLHVVGNMKFDMTLDDETLEKGKKLREKLGVDRPVWIAASTHDGEEEQVLSAFKKIKQTVPNSLLILVPRHPDRFDQVANLCQQHNFKTARHSLKEACTEDTAIYLGDTMGEMFVFYGACDVAFVGGSLVPTGGHNLLEPAELKKPLLSGPHVFNFAQISHLLEEAGALIFVENADALANAVIQLLQDKTLQVQQGEKALRIVEQNRGALMRQVEGVERFFT